ncbi:MAG TPA: CHAT domain-containing protein [Pyrinomonadaceae bacterium]|nr:CHAT domain-containing protein [Pyrinomonadaceae bacterium]
MGFLKLVLVGACTVAIAQVAFGRAERLPHNTADPRDDDLHISAVTQGDAPPTLRIGQSVTKTINGGGRESFKFHANAADYLRVSVNLRGIILRAALVAQDGKPLLEMNSPAGGYGTIYLSHIPATSGDYTLHVWSTEAWANPGSFSVTLEELKPATAADRERVAAEQSFARAIKDDDSRSFASAIENFGRALTFWRSVNDRHWKGLTLYALGQTYSRASNLKKAGEALTEALQIELDESDWRLRAAIINDLGFNKALNQENEAAIRLLNESIGLFKAHNDARGQASSMNNLAITYGRMGEFRKALALAEQAVPLRRAENFQSGVNNLLNTIGNIYDRLGEPYRSVEYFTQALEGWKKLEAEKQLDSPERLANGLNSLALAYERIGEANKSADLYEQALEVPKIGAALRAAILNNRGALYASLGDFDTAIEYLTESETLLKSLERPDPDVTASVLLQLGQIRVARGDVEAGTGFFQRARDTKPNNPKLAYVLTALGDAYSRQGNLDEAAKAFSDALEIQLKIQDLRGQAVTFQKRGEIQGSRGMFAEASKDFDLALARWRSVLDPRGEAATLNEIARLERKQNRPSEGLKRSNEAIALFESLRTSISSYQLRTSYFASRSDYYETNIDLNVLLAANDPSGAHLIAAFESSERARARTLIDTLTDSRMELGSAADLLKRYRETERKLRIKLEAQTTLLSSRHQQSESDAIANEVADLIRQHDELKGRIRAANPAYANLAERQPLTARELQQQLESNTVLLEYALGEKRSYVFAVTNDAIKAVQLDPRDKIELVANRLVQALTPRNREEPNETPQQRKTRQDKADKDYAEAAQQLSKMVIEPVASVKGQKRLVIVADGALQYVPFSALPISEPSTQGTSARLATTAANAPATLIDKYEIVSLPSASVLALQRREFANRKPAPLKLAILADPVFDLQDPRVATALAKPNRNRKGSDTSTSNAPTPSQNKTAKTDNLTLVSALRDIGLNPDGTLRRLVLSRSEAADIARLVPPNESLKALDFKASRVTALSGQLSKYQYVHFATHGVLSLEHPELSGIALSMVDEKGQKQDGYLRLYEIYNLNLPAELVVLSACETGVGKQIRGEGLIALTRGFMYAGAKRVVATLWKVDDSATAALMAEFYRQMFINKKRPAEALKEAQLYVSKQKRWRSPYYWAGFVLQGEWR